MMTKQDEVDRSDEIEANRQATGREGGAQVSAAAR
jgi:hypothetical protein